MKASSTTEDGLEALAGGGSAGMETLLRVDLRSDSGGELPSSAVALVSDLLAAEGDEIRELPPGLVTATFRQTARAVNAARLVQRAVSGFSRASTTGPLRAWVTLIHAKDVGDPAEAATDGSGAQRQGDAGQVLFVGGICEVARSIPGLQFAQTTEGLQLLPPVHMEGYVEEAVEIRVPIAASDLPLAEAEMGWEHGGSGAQPASVEQSPARAEAAIPERPMAGTPASTWMPAGEHEVAAKAGVPRWAIFGVAVVVVVAILAAAWVFGPFSKGASHSATPAATQDQGAQQTAAPAPAGGGGAQPIAVPAATPTPAAEKPVRLPPPSKAASTVAVKETNAAASHPASELPAAAPPVPTAEAAEPHSNLHGITYTPAEITSLLARAEKDAGNGNYDRAILEYKTVLGQEPANAQAKQGLAKALYNQSHR